MGDRTRLILALMLGLIALSVAQAATEPSRVVPASDVLAKIKANQSGEFDNCTIVGDLDLSTLKIEGQIHFNHTLFKNSVHFNSTIFNRTAYFRNSNFNGTVYFVHSNFNIIADFWSSNFTGDADFRNSNFNNIITNFGSSNFNGDADFRNSNFNNMITDFGSSNFNGDADFRNSNFNGDADFGNLRFGGYSDFSEVVFKKTTLILGEDSVFSGTLNLTKSNINSIDSYVRWDNLKHLEYNIKIYNIFFDNYKKWRLIDDYNKCYYTFKVESFKREPLGIGKLLDFGQWILYGFGLRPDFPIAWSMIVILISGFIFYRTKSIRKSNTLNGDLTKGEALIFSTIYFTSGASNIISSQPTDFSPVGNSRYVAILERLLGWVFFVLFLTSLGNMIAH